MKKPQPRRTRKQRFEPNSHWTIADERQNAAGLAEHLRPRREHDAYFFLHRKAPNERGDRAVRQAERFPNFRAVRAPRWMEMLEVDTIRRVMCASVGVPV